MSVSSQMCTKKACCAPSASEHIEHDSMPLYLCGNQVHYIPLCAPASLSSGGLLSDTCHIRGLHPGSLCVYQNLSAGQALFAVIRPRVAAGSCWCHLPVDTLTSDIPVRVCPGAGGCWPPQVPCSSALGLHAIQSCGQRPGAPSTSGAVPVLFQRDGPRPARPRYPPAFMTRTPPLLRTAHAPGVAQEPPVRPEVTSSAATLVLREHLQDIPDAAGQPASTCELQPPENGRHNQPTCVPRIPNGAPCRCVLRYCLCAPPLYSPEPHLGSFLCTPKLHPVAPVLKASLPSWLHPVDSTLPTQRTEFVQGLCWGLVHCQKGPARKPSPLGSLLNSMVRIAGRGGAGLGVVLHSLSALDQF